MYKRQPAFRSLLEQAISGHELVTAVCASQVISNVPAALLLSGFTSEWDAQMCIRDRRGS